MKLRQIVVVDFQYVLPLVEEVWKLLRFDIDAALLQSASVEPLMSWHCAALQVDIRTTSVRACVPEREGEREREMEWGGAKDESAQSP